MGISGHGHSRSRFLQSSCAMRLFIGRLRRFSHDAWCQNGYVLADSHHHKTMQCKPWHDSIFIICWSFPGLGNHYMPRLHISSPQSIIQKPKSQESKIQIPKSKSLNSNPTTKYKFMWNHADSKNM